MAAIVSGQGGGRGRDDDYDWLYSPRPGKGQGQGQGQEQGQGPRGHQDPDATRMIPVSRRPDGSPPHQPPRQPPGQPAGHPEPPRSIAPLPGAGRRRPRFRVRWLLYVVLAWLLYLVAVPVWAWTSVSTVEAFPESGRPAEQPGTTYLVVGSDARQGLGGARTDTIMLLHTGRGPNLLMSIPRDSLVEVPGQGVTKINAAFAVGGPRLLVRTLEQATGIRVDEYVEIGFTGLVEMVDAVGGVTICPETAIRDPQADLDIPQGCQEADGATALGYARSRKTQQLGDIDRARHQREVVSAIGSEVLSWRTVLNPVRYWRTVNAGASSVRVSDGTGPFAAARFAFGMTRTDGGSGLTCGVPIIDLAVNWDPERAARLFALIAEDRTSDVGGDLCRPSGLPS